MAYYDGNNDPVPPPDDTGAGSDSWGTPPATQDTGSGSDSWGSPAPDNYVDPSATDYYGSGGGSDAWGGSDNWGGQATPAPDNYVDPSATDYYGGGSDSWNTPDPNVDPYATGDTGSGSDSWATPDNTATTDYYGSGSDSWNTPDNYVDPTATDYGSGSDSWSTPDNYVDPNSNTDYGNGSDTWNTDPGVGGGSFAPAPAMWDGDPNLPNNFVDPNSDNGSTLTGPYAGAVGFAGMPQGWGIPEFKPQPKGSDPVGDFLGQAIPNAVNAFQNSAPVGMGTNGLPTFLDGRYTPAGFAGNVGNAIPKAAQLMSLPFAPFGAVTDKVADSNVPVVSNAAQGIRSLWENVFEPVGQSFEAGVGAAIKKGQIPGSYATLYEPTPDQAPIKILIREALKDPATIQQLTQMKVQAVQEEYNRQIASGASDEVATEKAKRLESKLDNPLNLAQYQGLQDLNSLPPWLSTAIQLVSPSGNLIFGKMAGEAMRGYTGVARAALDASGLPKVAEYLGEKIESPQQQYNTGKVAIDALKEPIVNYVKGQKALGDGRPDVEILADTLNPNSEVYYKKVFDTQPEKVQEQLGDVIRQDIEQAKQEMGAKLEAQNKGSLSPEGELAVKSREPVPLEKPVTDSEPVPPTERTPSPEDVTLAGKIAEADKQAANTDLPPIVRDKAQATADDLRQQQAANAEFDAIGSASDPLVQAAKGTKDPAITSTTPTAKPADTTPVTPAPKDKYQPPAYNQGRKGFDYLNADTSQIIEHMTTSYSLKTKAAKLTEKGGVVPTARFEQYGTPGKVLGATTQGLGLGTKAIASGFLPTMSRAVRDTAGNLIKYFIEGYGALKSKKVDAEFKRLGGVLPENMAGGQGVDVGAVHSTGHAHESKKKLTRGQIAGEALTYGAQGPIIAPANIALRLGTKGKVKDFNVLTDEVIEGNLVKGSQFKQEYTKLNQEDAKGILNNESYPQNLRDSLKELNAKGNMTPEQLQDFIAARLPASSNMADAYTGTYRSTNLSPEVTAKADALKGTPYEGVTSVMDTIPQKLDTYNQVMQKSQGKGYVPATENNIGPNHPVYTGLRGTNGELIMERGKPVLPGVFEEIKTLRDNLTTQIEAAERAAMKNSVPPGTKVTDPLVQLVLDDRDAATNLASLKQYIESAQAKAPTAYTPDILERTNALRNAGRPLPKDAAPQANPNAAIRSEILAYGKQEGKSFSANRMLAVLEDRAGPKDADRVLVRRTDDKGVSGFKLPKKDEVLPTDEVLHDPSAPKATPVDTATTTTPPPDAGPTPQERIAAYQKELAAPTPMNKEFVDPATGQTATGNVLTPDAARKLANSYGTKTRVQRDQYRKDMLATDAHIRDVTGNRYKLDPQTFEPVSVKKGTPLFERKDSTLPGETDTAKTLGSEVETKVQKVLDDMGIKGDTLFSDLPEAQKTIVQTRIAQEILGVDPHDPMVATQAQNAHGQLLDDWSNSLKDDISNRYQKEYVEPRSLDAAARAEQEVASIAKEKEVTDLARQALALRAQIQARASQKAYQRVKEVFFDYNSKNVLDQVADSVIPFNFWARHNFAYAAKRFAVHPYQFALMLNLFKQMEAQNKANGEKSWNLGKLIFPNGDGSKIAEDFSSFFTPNPFGNTDSLLQLLDSSIAGNKNSKQTLMQMLFGQDKERKNKDGSKTFAGRDMGLFSTFFRPNPIIDDLLLKTGLFTGAAKGLGLTKDNLGMPGPSANQTIGLMAGRTGYRDIGAASGLSQWLHEKGLLPGALDPEAPINSILYGKNAGKPTNQIIQELADMVRRKEITQEVALKASAALKDGNFTPAGWTAYDRINRENAVLRVAALVGFTGSILNRPREQEAAKLSKAYGSVASDKGEYVTSKDPVTGKDKTTFVPGQSQQFFKDNPAASVLFSANKDSNQILQSVQDTKTGEKVSALYAQRDSNKAMTTQEFNAQMDKLKAENPTYFERQDKNREGKANGTIPLRPGEKMPTIQTPEQIAATRKYFEQLDEFKRLGGTKFDQLSAQANKLYNSSDPADKQKAYKIFASDAYKLAKAQQQGYFADHPDFKAQYDQFQKDKYGKDAPTADDLKYKELNSQYQNIGGDALRNLAKKAADLYAAGDKAGAAKIYNSEAFKRGEEAKRQFTDQYPEFASRYDAEQQLKGNKGLKSEVAYDYQQKSSDYYGIGGDAFRQLDQQYQALRAAGDLKGANAIYASAAYQQVKKTQAQFKLDNPEFAAQLALEQEAKYGTKPPGTATGTTGSTYTSGAKKPFVPYAKKPFVPYASAAKKPFVPYARSATSGAPGAAKVPFTPYAKKPFTPFVPYARTNPTSYNGTPYSPKTFTPYRSKYKTAYAAPGASQPVQGQSYIPPTTTGGSTPFWMQQFSGNTSGASATPGMSASSGMGGNVPFYMQQFAGTTPGGGVASGNSASSLPLPPGMGQTLLPTSSKSYTSRSRSSRSYSKPTGYTRRSSRSKRVF